MGEARFPGTNEGVLEMARTGREDERNGAGSERIWTEFGRRSCWPGGVLENALCIWDCGDVTGPEDGGLAGAVTERLILMPRGKGAGPEVAIEERRRGTMTDPSPLGT